MHLFHDALVSFAERRVIHMINIEYRTQKDLPCKELYQLFLAVGWATEDETTQAMIDNFNIGFINSTFVFSAWSDEQLVGCVRVLSDLHFRSIIYDLAVLLEFQNKGIGSELVRRCNENALFMVKVIKSEKHILMQRRRYTY